MGKTKNEVFRIDWLDEVAITIESKKLKKLGVHMSEVEHVKLSICQCQIRNQTD